MHRLAQHQCALVLSVAALAAAACGGSSGGSKTATSGLTPGTTATSAQAGGAAFVAQGRGVCRRANAAAVSAEGDAHRLAAVLDRYLPEFRSVSAPPSLQPT